ncbi:inactive dipeptidyl peptidase 10-like [Macrosteles quadrilineatus]|uniref:inactive dipeptidyl peptidase 10-like n=1 Tax=Macrosteles quadrilineatus TaxID=74068 RepID=UPI0023E0DB5F|nr:inactive dipeptidyl peptidase 10-like [Macrosteles quadrilineatus]XP_054275244.1 inactive dipeptidyl peptidase 10-like [Macrosteles quadrilineatus]XP_054275245.1 inactive dipeptidyl peptidase 10-like [Macrosteles quadrilineatus]
MSDPDNYDDELVSSNTNQRNWRGILIALLVIMMVLALIVTSVVLLTPPDEGPRVKGTRLKLQDILSHDLTALRHNGSWISGEELIFSDDSGGISIFNAANLTTRVLMTNQTFRRLNPVKFSMSPDHRYLLLIHNAQKLFRYSFLAQYSIYDIAAMDIIPLTPTPDEDDHPYLLHAAWTPRGHSLIMVYNYDVYYRPTPRGRQVYRVSKTAVPGVISNGVPDWLYEEEILNHNTALWMSEDGHMLLYACFNDTQVQELRFPWYGVAEEEQPLYPDMRGLRYPKPSTKNPVVTLYVADLADPKNIRIRDLKAPMALGQTTDYYFCAVTWVSSTEVSVIWLNRAQNVSMVTLCKSPMWFCQETQRVSGEGRGWVDCPGTPQFSPDGNVYITLAPVRDGNAGYYRHIVSVNIPKKRLLPLTHGTFEVNKIVAWDHTNQIVYYLGVPQNKPGQLHLYAVSSAVPRSGTPLTVPQCLTCGAPVPALTTHYEGAATLGSGTRDTYDWEDQPEPATTTEEPERKRRKKKEPSFRLEPLYRPCTYHNIYFSPGLQYYIDECLGPGIPTVTLYTTYGKNTSAPAIENIQPQLLATLQNNSKLYDRISKVALPQVKTFPVQISGGYQAQVRLHLPPGLREEEITRYPLVLQVYGGPGSQLVTDRWKVDWNTYLASSRDLIVAQIDGRGSAGQGYLMLHQVYHRLGTVEVADQLEVAEYLKDNLHFIDKRRVAVWGWSYGGFVSAKLLSTPDQDVFQCGISVAPVTSWKLYDSAYTERYMGMPTLSGNYKGYQDSDLSRQVEGFKDKMFYLVHGTADDNVHLQQSMVLARALSQAGIIYRQQIYPDESHALSGVKKHLYRSMANFLDDCFRKQVPPELKAGLRNGGTFMEP